MVSSDQLIKMPREEFERKVYYFIERLEKINKFCKRREITDTIESLRKLLTEKFECQEEFLATFKALKEEHIAFMKKLKSEMKLLIHRIQSTQGNR